MKPFEFCRPGSIGEAISLVADADAKYYAGGTNLLDLMKRGVEDPARLVDVRRVLPREITATNSGGVLIGAGTTNSAVANHRLIRTQYPVLSQAILSGATTQLRNMATAGGNLVQRTRCPYFMDTTCPACNKRRPGSGCSAHTGFNREHALFGARDGCVAVHPSDMAVALAILDAVVHVQSAQGGRRIPFAEFFCLPDHEPQRDNSMRPGELITSIELPPSRYFANNWYLKVRDRHSYAFALVSVAVGLSLVDGVVKSAALALGGVAAKPWRVRKAEASLAGKPAVVENFRAAAELALGSAEPLSQNGFKIDLAKHSVVRALQRATATC